jgi:chromobox protein 1
MLLPPQALTHAAAISDEESGDDVPDQIPARGKVSKKAKQPEPEPEPGEDEEDEEGGDEYRVEKILDHQWNAKTKEFEYQVKWLGYEDADDLTWEPEDHLENSKEILNAYLKSIGGPPQPPRSGKKKGRAR